MSTCREFSEDGHTTVRDPATIALCEDLLGLASSFPRSSWTQVIRVNGVTEDYPLFSRDERIDDLHEEAHREAAAGLFSYSFARIAGSESNTRLPQWAAMMEMLASPAVTDLLTEHTGQSDLRTGRTYVNCFRHGDFLTTHSDQASGSRLVAAFSLTRAWDPRDGGCTHILGPDRRTVVDSVAPSLGCLLLINLRGREIPHYVSEVIRPPADAQRFTRMTLIAQYS